MQVGRLQTTIEIPEGVSIELKESTVTVKGPLGKLEKDFAHTKIQIELREDEVHLSTYFPRKREKALLGTVKAHIQNMIDGTRYGFKYMLKIVFAHFPIRVNPELNKNRIKIENLYGGRKPRYAKVLPGVKVEVLDEDVVVTGMDREAVGQTSANIQELTRLHGKRRKSPKTFMDGIFLYHKEFENTPSSS